jgi:pimeloyl-ACP methyl ester carboxylesterase
MFFSPVSVLGMWFRGLLAIAILAGGMYLIYRWQDELPRSEIVFADREQRVRELPTFIDRLSAWRPDWNRSTAELAAGVCLLAWALIGSRIYPRALRASGADEPHSQRIGKVVPLNRPDGTELRVECIGPADAPRLVLTHGWGCDSTEWYYTKRHFAKKYRVVVWDLPGLGLSTQPANRDYSLEKMAADLRAVLTATGNQPAILVGHSIGGMTLLTFSRLFPELLGNPVVGLVLAHTTYLNPLKTMRFASIIKPLQKPLVEPMLWLTIALSPVVWLMNCLSYLNGSAHRSTERQSFAGTETKGQLDFAARYSLKASPAVVARGAFGMLRYDAADVLERITIPTLVCIGDGDPVTLPEAGESMRDELKHSQHAALVPAKHLGLLEHHEAFNNEVERFAAESFRIKAQNSVALFAD